MNNLYSILNEGLKPIYGFRSYSIQDDETGVYLSKGINNSIQMFSHMVNYFYKVIGYEGDIELINCQMELQNINHYGFGSNEIIKECKSTIDRIRKIKECNNFYQYLGGVPYLLSVNGIQVIDESQPDNCCYKDVIPPQNINIVYLRNKYTNMIFFNLEAIYYYYRITNPNIRFSNDSIDDVNKFFNNIYNYYRYMNPNDFELIEEPILDYFKRINNEKTLTLR